jgi:hypothetical protein
MSRRKEVSPAQISVKKNKYHKHRIGATWNIDANFTQALRSSHIHHMIACTYALTYIATFRLPYLTNAPSRHLHCLWQFRWKKLENTASCSPLLLYFSLLLLILNQHRRIIETENCSCSLCRERDVLLEERGLVMERELSISISVYMYIVYIHSALL